MLETLGFARVVTLCYMGLLAHLGEWFEGKSLRNMRKKYRFYIFLPSTRGGSSMCFPSTMSEIHFDFAYGSLRVDIKSRGGKSSWNAH